MNEKFLKERLVNNLKGVGSNINHKTSAIVEALNSLDRDREWTKQINTNQIKNIITNSINQDELINKLVEALSDKKETKQSLKESVEPKQKLNEATSNFGNMIYLPLLVFYVYDEDRDDDSYGENVCILDNSVVEDLVSDLEEFNDETKEIAYELDIDENGYQMYGDNLNLEDITLKADNGYYDGAYIKCNNEKYFDYLDEDVKKAQIERFTKFLNEMKSKYGLTQLKVGARFSNGETWYDIVEKLKESSLDQYVLETRDGIYKENGKIKLFDTDADAMNFANKSGLKDAIARMADEDDINENLKESEDEIYIYQFPKDINLNYVRQSINLTSCNSIKLVGKVGKGGDQPGDILISGTKADLEKFADDYFDYTLNPDYLYEEDEFDTSLIKPLSMKYSFDKNLKEDNNQLARKMGAKFLPPKDYGVKKKRPRYVYEVYWYTDEDCSDDPIFKKFPSNKARDQWYEQHKDDPDKFSMCADLAGYNVNENYDVTIKDKKTGETKTLKNRTDNQLDKLEQNKNIDIVSTEPIEENLKEDREKNISSKSIKENKLKEMNDYFAYLDKDYANLLDSNVDVYDIKSFVEKESNGEYTTHYTDKYAIIVCANGKGCVVDYEAVGQDFDSVDSDIEFGIVENKNDEYIDEKGVKHRTISLVATHNVKTTPKEVMEKAPKETMKYRDFFRKYNYNDRCAYNFKDLAKYISANNGIQEGCNSKKKSRKLKEGYIGQTLYDFLNDCVDPELIENVNLWDDDDVIYEGDYEGAIDEYGDNEFIEFDCGMDKVVINVDTSEQYQITDYYVDVQDFIDFFNGDEIEVYDLNSGETLFNGYKDECPDDVLEKIFISFDAPKFISINIEEDEDDDFDESLKESHKIKVNGNKIKIDDEEYELLDQNDTYYLFRDKNGIQEIRKDGKFDSEYFFDDLEESNNVETRGEKEKAMKDLYGIAKKDNDKDALDSANQIKKELDSNPNAKKFDKANGTPIKESNDVLKLQNGGFAYISDYNKDQFEKEYVETGKYKESGRAQSPKGKYTLYTNSVGSTWAVLDENLKEALDKIQEVTKAIDCDGNEFSVKPIWKTDRLATLVDKDGNKTRVEIADLRQYYDLYDQDDEIISRFEDNVDENLKEDNKSFNDKMDFLAKDEDEAIDGYKKVIPTIDNKNVKTQLKKIETEEKAHKDYLTKVKSNKDIEYTEPLEEDTIKQDGKWVNKGNKGDTHGTFKTKKEAYAQRKAMFVNKKPNAKWGK